MSTYSERSYKVTRSIDQSDQSLEIVAIVRIILCGCQGSDMMNVLGFAEEFSRLILRYTKTPSTNDDQSQSVKPMTPEEIASTIDTVLSTLRMKSTNIGNILDNSSADSSVNTTVINTLAASYAGSTPIKQEDCARRFSLTHLEPTSNYDVFVSRSSLGADGTETRAPLNNLRDADKCISRSSPIIRVNSIGRSDTFVREEGEDVIMTNNTDDVFENVWTVETNESLNDNFLVSFNEMRMCVMELENKLDKTLEKYLHLTKQKRSLKLLKCSSDLTNRSTAARTKTNSPMTMNKSMNTSGTSTTTTTKLRAVGKENISVRRKSIASIGKNEKLNRSARVGHSVSNLSLSAANSTSGGFARNSKYAHVQSTIPKLSNRTSNKKM